MRKFFNKPVINEYGKFDSTGEANRYKYLLEMEKKGKIRNLRRQEEYELIPKQTKVIVVPLKTKDKYKDKFLEHPLYYKCDFVYEKPLEIKGFLDTERNDFGVVARQWQTVVEDFKGSLKIVTEEFRIKKKLMLWVYNIEVKIVTNPYQEV